jgi:hypothetical protein
MNGPSVHERVDVAGVGFQRVLPEQGARPRQSFHYGICVDHGRTQFTATNPSMNCIAAVGVSRVCRGFVASSLVMFGGYRRRD